MTSRPVTRRHRTDGEGKARLVSRWQRGTEGSGRFPHARAPHAAPLDTGTAVLPPPRPAALKGNGPNGSAPEHGAAARPAAALRERSRRGREGGSGTPGPPPAATGPRPAPREAPRAAPRRRTAAPPQPRSHLPPTGPGRFPRGRRAAPRSGGPAARVTTRRNSPTAGRGSPVLCEAARRGSRPDRLGLPPTAPHRPPRGREQPRRGALTGPDRRRRAGARSAGGAAARPLYRPPSPRPRARGRWRCVTSPGRRAEGR